MKSVLSVHWKDWCWSWNSHTSATWFEELTHLKRPWCWERLKAGGEGDNRGCDGWMALPTQWTWVLVDSRSWWQTGEPGMLQSTGSQRVRHDWATELNWAEPKLSVSKTWLCSIEKTAQLLVRSRIEEGRKGMLGGEISSCLTIKSSSRAAGPHFGRRATDSSRWVSSEGTLHRWASQRTMGTGEEPRERGSMPRPGKSGRGQWSEQQKPHPQLQGSGSPSKDGRQHTGYPKTSSGGLLNWVLISSSFCADSVPSHHWATQWVLNLVIGPEGSTSYLILFLQQQRTAVLQSGFSACMCVSRNPRTCPWKQNSKAGLTIHLYL